MYSCGERGLYGLGALPTTILSLNMLFATKPHGFNANAPTRSRGLQTSTPGTCMDGFSFKRGIDSKNRPDTQSERRFFYILRLL